MGKASSSKKVARAARAGRSAGTAERRDLGFPILMGVVIILGILLVTYARTQRNTDDKTPTLRDHWHSVYGVWDCQSEAFLDHFVSDYDPRGIHSHNDGLVHIHPFSSAVTGDGATLDVFFEAMLVDLDDDKLTTPEGVELVEGTECFGEEAVLQVARWDASTIDGDPVDTQVGDIGSFVFEGNREAITIALAPAGYDLPPPPAERFQVLDVASPDRGTPNTSIPTNLGADDTEDTGDTDGEDPGDTSDPGDTGEAEETEETEE